VGYYRDTAAKTHGFLLEKRGGFVSIDYPGATYTDSWGINPAGDIVGSYLDSHGISHGYLLRRDRFTAIDVPGAVFTGAFDINPEGDIAGHYGVPPTGKMNGFLLRNGQFTTYDFSPPSSVFMTCGVGINPQGQIVGMWQDASGGQGTHGYVLDEGVFTSIDIPNGINTQAYGVSPNGEIGGFFTEKTGPKVHGFVLDRGGALTQIDVLGAARTWVRRINARGDLVGNYQDADSAGNIHGFLIGH